MSGKITVSNIVVGEAKVFAGPDQTTVDADMTTNGDNSVFNLGATQGGVAISWEPTMVDIEVDQFGDAARVIQNKQKVMIKTTLAEATLTNLALVWGYATGVGAASPGLQSGYTPASGGTMNLGIHSVYPTERYIRFQGNAPGTTATTTVYRTYKNRRAVQYSASSHSLTRTENVKFEVDFRILPDSTQTGAEYGQVIDQTGAPYTPYL